MVGVAGEGVDRQLELDLRARVLLDEGGGGAVVRRSIAPWLFLLAGILAILEAILRTRRPLRAAA